MKGLPPRERCSHGRGPKRQENGAEIKDSMCVCTNVFVNKVCLCAGVHVFHVSVFASVWVFGFEK